MNVAVRRTACRSPPRGATSAHATERSETATPRKLDERPIIVDCLRPTSPTATHGDDCCCDEPPRSDARRGSADPSASRGRSGRGGRRSAACRLRVSTTIRTRLNARPLPLTARISADHWCVRVVICDPSLACGRALGRRSPRRPTPARCDPCADRADRRRRRPSSLSTSPSCKPSRHCSTAARRGVDVDPPAQHAVAAVVVRSSAIRSNSSGVMFPSPWRGGRTRRRRCSRRSARSRLTICVAALRRRCREPRLELRIAVVDVAVLVDRAGVDRGAAPSGGRVGLARCRR